MLPLSRFSRAARAAVRGVLTDIDDTLTTDGKLTALAYGAMERLRAAGLLVVPVTGRPAGWCDHIARMWPVDAVVGENGAFYFRYDREAGKLRKRYLLEDAERAENRRRLTDLRVRVLEAVPAAAVASDQGYRDSDLAIDVREDVAPLAAAEIDRILELCRQAGATAKLSSVHVNAWFGTYDKLTMTRICFEECFGIDLDAHREHFVFAGDSPNDAPMFGFFPNAVGVANLADFAGRLSAEPRFITASRAGAGFAELAAALLAARGGQGGGPTG